MVMAFTQRLCTDTMTVSKQNPCSKIQESRVHGPEKMVLVLNLYPIFAIDNYLDMQVRTWSLVPIRLLLPNTICVEIELSPRVQDGSRRWRPQQHCMMASSRFSKDHSEYILNLF